MPRIADAKRAVREAFRLHAELRGKMAQVGYLRKRKLACQRDALGSQCRLSNERVFRVGIHLR